MKVSLGTLGSIGVVRDRKEYDVPPEGFTDARNVRFTTGGPARFTGSKVVLGDPISARPSWLHFFSDRVHPVWTYADNENVFVIEDEANHHEITRAGSDYNGDFSERWNADTYGGRGLFNNTIDVPQDWSVLDPTGGTLLQDLPNWIGASWSCKFIHPFKSFLFAGNLHNGTTRFPYRIRWSNSADPGLPPPDWEIADPASLGGEVDLAETEDIVVDALGLGDYFIVYKEETTWAFQFVGGQSVFRNWRFLDDNGLLARNCAVAIPQGHIFMSSHDVGIHNGQRGSFVSIFEDRLRKWLFNQIDEENFFNCFLVDNRPLKEVWICFPEAGAEYATTAIVWNWQSGGVGFRDLDNVPFIYPGPTVVADSDTSDAWDAGPNDQWDANDTPWGGSTLAIRGKRYPVLLEWGGFTGDPLESNTVDGPLAEGFTTLVLNVGLSVDLPSGSRIVVSPTDASSFVLYTTAAFVIGNKNITVTQKAGGNPEVDDNTPVEIFAAPAPIFTQSENGNLYNEAPFVSYVERTGLTVIGADRTGKPLLDPDSIRLCRGIYPILDAPPGFEMKIRLGFQDTLDSGVDWVSEDTFVQGRDEMAEVLGSGRYMAVHFEAISDLPWTMTGYSIDIVNIGRHHG